MKLQQAEVIDETEEFNQTKPLATSFFQRLLALEDRIINNNYTLDILLELVKYYTRAIEYYDYMQDKIQCYFLEKMQSTLSRIESLKLLFPKKEEENKKNLKEEISPILDGGQTPIEFQQSEELNESIEKKAKKREKQKRMNFRQRQTSYAQTHSDKILDYDLNSKRIERAKKMQIFMESTENQKQTDFELISGKYLDNYLLKDNIIQSCIHNQNQQFKKRLQQCIIIN